MPSADVEHSSDEEIGPMPTADGADEPGAVVSNGRKKKKRAGESGLRPKND